MSWVFLAGARAYKLKKPVRFRYLDFSSLHKRETACRAELRLNRRLTSGVYLGIVPLRIVHGRFSIGGDTGAIADWLVVMRRLDETRTLEHALLRGQVSAAHVERLVHALVHFYRTSSPGSLSSEVYQRRLSETLASNRRLLLDPRLGLPFGLVRRITQTLHDFLERRYKLLAERTRRRHIRDGHGDLRPEHIWLEEPLQIIDCLEFDANLRMVDPLDELAFLDLECERLGSSSVGRTISRKVTLGLHQRVREDLYLFYRCLRATLRARLAIAHLLEPAPRTPRKWLPLAKSYLNLAKADAQRLDILLRTQGDP